MNRLAKGAAYLFVASGIGVAFATNQGLSSAPGLYVHADVPDRDQRGPLPEDPKAEIRIGNMGWGTMYLYDVRIMDRQGNEVDNVAEVLKSPRNMWAVSPLSSSFDHLGPVRVFSGGHVIPVVTVRPVDGFEGDDEWFREFVTVLKDTGLQMRLSTTWQSPVHLPPKTSMLPICQDVRK